MGSNFNVNDPSVLNLFKVQYKQKSFNTYNGKVPFLGRVRKSFDFVGYRREMDVSLGYQGGVGSGSLPVANRGVYEKPYVTPKRVFAVTEIDRMTIKTSVNEGAFVSALKETVKKTVEKFNWNVSRILWNTLANGSLGTIDSVTDNGGGNYSLVITTDTWKWANWEVRDYVNIGANTDLFEIMSVTESTRTIVVQRITGSKVPSGSELVYMQKSAGSDPQSFAGVCRATAGSLYGVTVQDRWKAYQINASSAGYSSGLLNRLILGTDRNCGVSPQAIYSSYTQYLKALDSMEDQKFYDVAPRADNLKGVVSFTALQVSTPVGLIPWHVDRFCDEDSIFAVTEDQVELLHAPDMGWIDDEGFSFLRKVGDDSYEARYGAYMESFVIPSSQGVIYGLSTTGGF